MNSEHEHLKIEELFKRTKQKKDVVNNKSIDFRISETNAIDIINYQLKNNVLELTRSNTHIQAY